MQSPETRQDETEATATSPDRPIPPRRLGAWLRAERLRRSESLAEVERDIHVTRAYLEAIEEEHFDVLPAPVYTRGFVRLYARRLGLNVADAVAMLPADLPIPPGLEPSAALRRPGREAPAISLPRVPSMRVPALRIPEMRTPRGGFRLPSMPSLPSLPAGGASMPALSADARRWGLAALGVVVLILSAVLLPRAFDGGGSSATATPTTTAATAQATVQAGGAPSGGTSSGGASSGTQPQPTPAGGAAAAAAVAVPNLVGVARADAQARLQDAGLTSVVVEIASATIPAGQVASQQPLAGASLNRGENVTLIVSRGAPRN